jgi:type I restriction enzyme M protein
LDGGVRVQFSIVKYSDVLNQFDMRFDADFYKPKYLREDKQLKKHKSISVGDFAFVTDGQHGYHEVDENSPILHLTAKNAKGWFANAIGADRIAKWVDDKNKRSSLIENDLILSTRGTVGYCAIVKLNVLPANIDQDVARIAIDKNVFSPEYVLTFLNCEYGQDWIKRNTTGMVQQGLSLQKVRQTPIPVLHNDFQNYITLIVDSAHNRITISKTLHQEAQSLLLSELGLTDWQPKHQLAFIKNYSDTQNSERIDAEYYQPKYEEIIKAIKNYSGGWETLKNLVHIKKSIEVGSGEYIDEGAPFVRVSNLSTFELTEEKYISESLYH